MIRKLLTLFKLGRKLAQSDILNVVSKFKKPPLVIKIFSKYFHFLFLVQKKVTLMSLRVKNFLNHYNQWEQPSLN